MQPIYLTIVDDEALFRKGLISLIKDFEGIELLSEASNGRELLDYLSTHSSHPNIVLLDLKMPILNGIETAKILERDYPNINVIVLSTYFSETFVFNMIEIGAASYLAKNTAPKEVEKTIQLVHKKGFYYSDEIIKIIRQNIIHKKQQSKASFDIQITKREQEILQLICEQYTNAEIAKKLYISNRTVDAHRNNLLQKFNCKNTAGLVAFAIQRKLITIDPSQFLF